MPVARSCKSGPRFEGVSDQDNRENITKLPSGDERRGKGDLRKLPTLSGGGESHACRLPRRHGGCRRTKTARCGRGKANETERMTEAEKTSEEARRVADKLGLHVGEQGIEPPAPHTHTPSDVTVRGHL